MWRLIISPGNVTMARCWAPRSALGDSDGDGDVDADDLLAFQLTFGLPPVFSGPISDILAVPEPGTIGLALGSRK